MYLIKYKQQLCGHISYPFNCKLENKIRNIFKGRKRNATFFYWHDYYVIFFLIKNIYWKKLTTRTLHLKTLYSATILSPLIVIFVCSMISKNN